MVKIRFRHKGDFKKTSDFLENATKMRVETILTKYAEQGLDALKAATPVDTGVTADSWSYQVRQTKYGWVIEWMNSSRTPPGIVNGRKTTGIPIVILIQYGHKTRGGGYVAPRDFINPIMQEVFERIAKDAWEEVTRE